MKSLYAIASPTGPTKIGIATAPLKRLRELNTSSSVRLTLAFSSEPTPSPLIVERVAHVLLKEKRLNGEWFDVPPEQAAAAIREALEIFERGEAEAFIAPTPKQSPGPSMTGAQLRALRKRFGWSQSVLADEMERGLRMIQKYESGEAEIPRVVALACASLALGLRDYPATD